MRRFNVFFEEFITQRRRFGITSLPGNDDPIKDVEAYKKKRERNTQPQTTFGVNIRDNIRRDINEELYQLMRYYGFKLKGEYFESLPKDGSLVYRGHKNIDPFSRGEDAKAEEGKVYFAGSASYAYGTYSVNYNKSSHQIGQSGFSSLQSRVQEPHWAKSFNIGFFTVATPKDPDNIKWYYNFGYEDKQQSFTRQEKDITTIGDVECVEPRESFSKIRTYLMYGDKSSPRMISFERLKKVNPRIYTMVMNARVHKSVDDPMRVM